MVFGFSGNAEAAGPICAVPGDYSSISAALGDAGCTTINVAAGTYPEHVTINRAVTLNGANANIAGFDPRGAESFITGDSTGAVEIRSDNVTFNGFNVAGHINDLGAGILVATTTQGVDISNNVIAANQIGVNIGSVGTSTVEFNLFDINNEPGFNGGTAIYSEHSTNLVIDHNDIRNHTSGYPVQIFAENEVAHSNLQFSFNTVHDNSLGMLMLGITGGTIRGNTIVGSSGAQGILFGGGDSNISVTDNGIFAGSAGVLVQDAGYGLPDSSNITINRNHLADHTDFGVNNGGGYVGLLDATCNWWAAADGPGPVGPGTGDKVSTDVTFAPWLTSSDLESECNGGQIELTHTIAASAGSDGSITPTGSVVVNDGDDQMFTITPNAGFHVADVNVDGTSIGATTTYIFTGVTADHTISASFEADQIVTHSITSSAGAHGTISPSGIVILNDGSDQTFSIVPDAGFHVLDVNVDGILIGATTSYTFIGVTADHTINASFEANPAITHTITASAGSNGSIDPSGSVVVTDGHEQLFTITPNSGFHVADVLVDGTSIGATTTYIFSSVTGDHTISASFEQNPIVTHTINASAGSNGSITPSGAVIVNDGSNQTFAISALSGFHIANVVFDGLSVGATSTYTFTSVTGDHTISASFEANPVITHTITASAGANGTISPSGSVVVNDGSNQTFTITALSGFHIKDVLVDGSTVGAVGTYTFSGVVADHTIAASFEVNPVSGGTTPTDKNQCKDSGWKTFSNPSFKNQGDCVSFVASKGKARGNP